MRILVVDSRGAGSVLAAFLAQSGGEVSLLADGEHLSAIERHDLLLDTGHGSFAIPMEVWTDAQAPRPPEVVFLCMDWEGGDTFLPDLRSAFGESAHIVWLSRPLHGGEQPGRMPPDVPVFAGYLQVEAERVAPGEIRMGGDGIQIVFDTRTAQRFHRELPQLERELLHGGIDVIQRRELG